MDKKIIHSPFGLNFTGKEFTGTLILLSTPAGNQYPVIFTFNNMRTLEEFATKATEELAVSKNELLTLLKDTDVLANLGFDSCTIMAMFIPNTYQIYWNTSALDLLKRMKKEYDRFWNENRMAKATAMGLSPEEVITLASIIEEETVKPEEYPVIAGVYVNRLNRGIKLDACPTLKYVLGDFTISRILDRYLKIDSPYNTYMYAGLPPGDLILQFRAVQQWKDFHLTVNII